MFKISLDHVIFVRENKSQNYSTHIAMGGSHPSIEFSTHFFMGSLSWKTSIICVKLYVCLSVDIFRSGRISSVHIVGCGWVVTLFLNLFILSVLVCWCVGVLVCWSVGVLVCWCVGVLVCWRVGVLAC